MKCQCTWPGLRSEDVSLHTAVPAGLLQYKDSKQFEVPLHQTNGYYAVSLHVYSLAVSLYLTYCPVYLHLASTSTHIRKESR